MLGLSDERTKDDNLFQRLFWPSNQPGEVDTLGQQGFWVCLVVAVFSGVTMVLVGHPLIGLLSFAFYGLGGVGIRQHSVAAAIFISFAYVANLLINLLLTQVPGVLTLIIAGLLLANIRGTYIASKWQNSGNLESPSESSTFFDWLVDQVPQRVWPSGRFLFFVLGAIYLALILLGAIGILLLSHRR